jgi:calcium-dependent protein kinase
MGCSNGSIKLIEKKQSKKRRSIPLSETFIKRIHNKDNKVIHRKISILQNKGAMPQFYKIHEKIGKGCFGKVYKVYHELTGQYRALKVIKKKTLNLQDGDREFLKEIEVLSQIEHPNIIKIFEYFDVEDSYFVIVELLKGYELMDAIVELDKFTEKQAIFIMEQLFSCVSFMHSKGILHRDLKLDNIMTENNNLKELNIKLIDFGSAYCLSKNDISKKLKLKIGSPYYMAPEVINGNYDIRCDNWSLGVIMYILLTGEPPFFGQIASETFDLVQKGIYNTSKPNWKNLSENAKDLISKFLIIDQNKRITVQQALKHPWITENKKNVEVDIIDIKNKITKFSSLQKFQQSILIYLIRNFSSNEYCKELKLIFKKMDTSGDGKLSYEELRDGFNIYFTGYNSLDIQEFLDLAKSIDVDGSGYIEYDEFLTAFLNKEILLTEKNLNSCFSHFDTDRSGKLSKNELKNVLGLFEKEKEDISVLSDMIKEIDMNKDGEISLEEFKNLMMKVIKI